MAARNKPYEQFGHFILFKKLESDALSELWRAGQLSDDAIRDVIAVRRLTGGDRNALLDAADAARAVVPLLHGPSFARQQIIDIIDDVPYVAHTYAGGRSLRHIVNRARGAQGNTPNPIPLEHAVVIAERVCVSLSTTAELRHEGSRLQHGALLPQFIWISDDGEIRVAGQGLGSGLAASLADPQVSAEIGRYFPPEVHAGRQVVKSSDVFGMGAIFFLTLTGQEPPDASNASAFATAIRAAKTMTGEPIPDDLRAILNKSLTVDPEHRYGSVAELKQAISAVAHSGKYTATTFNLAFYLSNLLKKEMEGEALEREREAKTNVVPYLDVHPEVAAAASMPALSSPAPARSKAPLAIAAACGMVAVGVGAWLTVGSKGKTPPPAATIASAVPIAPRPKIVSEPVIASGSEAAAGASINPATGSLPPADEAARKKAFEDAVNQKLQEEMMKLQAAHTRKLQQEHAKNAPVAVAPAAAAPSPAQPEPSAAALDLQRREATRAESAPAPSPQTVPATTAPAAPTPAVVAQTAPAPTINEGDVIEWLQLDAAPAALTPIRPVYPPLALRYKMEATVTLTVLISENGSVLDVKILKGAGKPGFDDAAMRAISATKFSAPMKAGKRVKTWYPKQILFKF